jgi:putative transposase
MPAKVQLRSDYDAVHLRQIARRCQDTRQVRRLLALAAVYDGMSRSEAARIGGMDRQTLRDWAHRFNETGPAGLTNRGGAGPKSRLTEVQLKQLEEIVETGPDPETDGVVRWRRVDLQGVIKARFGVEYHQRYVGVLLHKMGFSHMSSRPQHPKQSPQVIEDFKKLRTHAGTGDQKSAIRDTDRNLVPG